MRGTAHSQLLPCKCPAVINEWSADGENEREMRMKSHAVALRHDSRIFHRCKNTESMSFKTGNTPGPYDFDISVLRPRSIGFSPYHIRSLTKLSARTMTHKGSSKRFQNSFDRVSHNVTDSCSITKYLGTSQNSRANDKLNDIVLKSNTEKYVESDEHSGRCKDFCRNEKFEYSRSASQATLQSNRSNRWPQFIISAESLNSLASKSDYESLLNIQPQYTAKRRENYAARLHAVRLRKLLQLSHDAAAIEKNFKASQEEKEILSEIEEFESKLN